MEDRVAQLVSEMNNPERMIYICYYYNQMSVEKIANETGFKRKKIIMHLNNSTNKVIKEIGEGGIYYAALIAFLSMGDEAVNCQPPKNTKLIF